MALGHLTTTAKVNKDFVLRKCDYLADIGLWPRTAVMDPRLWLKNFEKSDREYAIHLLNAFIYLSPDLTYEMFISAFQNISRMQYSDFASKSYREVQDRWKWFLDNVLITHVTGERPNVTDSGYLFDRKARQLIGIPEERILDASHTLEHIYRNGPCPVVFVDDFVGSGQQFVRTWNRATTLTSHRTTSFAEASLLSGVQFFYCPVICTEQGHKEIWSNCPGVKICAAHILPPQYSALVPDSLVWPDHLRNGAFDFIRRVSLDAGMPDTNGYADNDWQGFKKLGLALAFEHSVPDATLCIFRWEENGWKPLIKRS